MSIEVLWWLPFKKKKKPPNSAYSILHAALLSVSIHRNFQCFWMCGNIKKINRKYLKWPLYCITSKLLEENFIFISNICRLHKAVRFTLYFSRLIPQTQYHFKLILRKDRKYFFFFQAEGLHLWIPLEVLVDFKFGVLLCLKEPRFVSRHIGLSPLCPM